MSDHQTEESSIFLIGALGFLSLGGLAYYVFNKNMTEQNQEKENEKSKHAANELLSETRLHEKENKRRNKKNQKYTIVSEVKQTKTEDLVKENIQNETQEKPEKKEKKPEKKDEKTQKKEEKTEKKG